MNQPMIIQSKLLVYREVVSRSIAMLAELGLASRVPFHDTDLLYSLIKQKMKSKCYDLNENQEDLSY